MLKLAAVPVPSAKVAEPEPATTLTAPVAMSMARIRWL
jgi:hypothetical protein